MKYLTCKLAAGLLLLTISLGAQASHQWSQAGNGNTNIDLTAGFGFDIPQDSLIAGSGSRADFYLTGFDSGDILCFQIGSFAREVDFDSLPAGWTLNPVGGTGASGNGAEPDLAALVLPAPFTWRISALAGEFTVEGARVHVAGGEAVGANTGPGIIQSAVTPNGEGCTGELPVPPAPVPLLGPMGTILLIIGFAGIAVVTRRLARKPA